jgi:hypothetical protein
LAAKTKSRMSHIACFTFLVKRRESCSNNFYGYKIRKKFMIRLELEFKFADKGCYG